MFFEFIEQWFRVFLLLLHATSGIVVLHFSIQALGEMGKGTNHGVRIAFILMAAGGFSQVLDLIPHAPRVAERAGDMLVLFAIAVLFLFDRRCVTCPRALPIAGAPKRRARDRVMSGKVAA